MHAYKNLIQRDTQMCTNLASLYDFAHENLDKENQFHDEWDSISIIKSILNKNMGTQILEKKITLQNLSIFFVYKLKQV
jgi:hypothetical protein